MNARSAAAVPTSASCPLVAETSAQRFRGVIVPLATPLSAIDALDVAGLERLVEHVIDGGVHAIFLLGTTGEGPSLSHATQRDLVRHVTRQAGHRVPVLVGITDPSFAESLAIAEWAAGEGAAAVVVAPPYYFPAAQDALVEWTRGLAERVPLPLMLYNIPELTKTSFAADSLRALSDCPNIVGLKDSSDDMAYFAEAVAVARERRPDWSVLVGPELRAPETHALGGHGVVPGGANVCPRLFADLHAALLRGDSADVASLHDRVRMLGALYSVGTLPGRVVVGIKNALAEMGICQALTATPLERLDGDQRRKVREILDRLGL
jgi:dihydrodipicolinate synthase/N-acetylneuraminate lyase